ncbi:YitT family protein [Cohnella sp. GCM10027633]|uniref:YitT family protein n=1 Tax=unclassified Cohnella TaxID=2636738 RepID=UPI00362CBE35
MDVTLQRLRAPASFAMTAAGAAMSAIGLELFLAPHSLIAGGTTGASLLVSHATGIHLGLLLLACNLGLFCAGYRRWSLRARWNGFIGLAVLSLGVHALRPFPALIDAPLPAAFAGGMLLGLGFGIAVRSGGFGDAADEAPKLLPGIKRAYAWQAVWIGNALLLVAIGYLSDWQAALHSALALAAMHAAADWTIERFAVSYVAAIRSERTEEIAAAIEAAFGRAASRVEATDPSSDALLIACHRSEWQALRTIVARLDPDAELSRCRG